ncbi:MAG: cupin domain-containing protein [Candidatus Ranarchaeia archaeon]
MVKINSVKDLPKTSVVPGLIRQSVSGQNMTIAFFTFKPNVAVPVHSHPHEQISYVKRGVVLYVIDGKEMEATKDQFVVIPPNVPHGASVVSDEGAEVIDLFSPVREDFK